MLERVVILPAEGVVPLGATAQALAYYGHVEVVCGQGSIAELVDRIGIGAVIRLAESDLVTFSLRPTMAASVQTPTYFGYGFACVTLQSRSAEGPAEPAELLERAVDQRLGPGVVSSSELARLAAALDLIPARYDELATGGAEGDVLRPALCARLLQDVLRYKVPGYPNIDEITARPQKGPNGGFWIDTNINYTRATNIAREQQFDSDDIALSKLLAPIVDMRSTIATAGDRRCDIWADPLQSQLLKTKISSFRDRLERGREGIRRFEDSVFQGSSFDDAARAGEVSLVDILNFAEKPGTRQFKAWLAGAPEGSDLLSEYQVSKVKASFLGGSLREKHIKRVIFASASAGIGAAVGAAAGMVVGSAVAGSMGGAAILSVAGNLVSDSVLSAADEFLAKHLTLGWNPSQWVQDASPYLRGY